MWKWFIFKIPLKDFKDIDLVGIDLSKAANFEEKINYIVGDFLTKNFNRKFDVLVSLAVIEHLDDINGFVKKCYEILNKNGIAYVMTLNESSILYQLSNILRKIGFPSFFIRLYDGHHLNHFSQRSLLELLTKDNLFKVIKVRNHNIPLRCIDIPEKNLLKKWIIFLGVVMTFIVGKMTNRCYLQTVIAIKVC